MLECRLGVELVSSWWWLRQPALCGAEVFVDALGGRGATVLNTTFLVTASTMKPKFLARATAFARDLVTDFNFIVLVSVIVSVNIRLGI